MKPRFRYTKKIEYKNRCAYFIGPKPHYYLYEGVIKTAKDDTVIGTFVNRVTGAKGTIEILKSAIKIAKNDYDYEDI